MNLNETTQKVLRLVEVRSGISVHVEPDRDLPGSILAKVVMARGALRLHRVTYRPDGSTPPDYLICAQAGSILRLFDTPPEKRFDFAASPEGDAAVERLVKAHPVARTLPTHALAQLCQMLRDGLLNHLRSIPVGMLAANFGVVQRIRDAASLCLHKRGLVSLASSGFQPQPIVYQRMRKPPITSPKNADLRSNEPEVSTMLCCRVWFVII